MIISSLADYLRVVEERLLQWTVESLHNLPFFPRRPDAEKMSKTAWFRGHSESRWELIPSVYRLPGYTLKREVEMNLAFLESSSQLPEKMPPKNDFPSWLSKMQHHGMPTRLLDWTEDPKVGLFFALKDSWQYARWKRSRWFTPLVWMMNPHALNWVSAGGSIIPTEDLLEWAGNDQDGWTPAWGCKNVFPAFGLSLSEAYEGPMAVQPRPVDVRMKAQHSRFTIHGKRAEPIDTMLRDSTEKDIVQLGFLFRIQINPAATEQILQELRRDAVSPSTVFPDIEGFAMEAAASF